MIQKRPATGRLKDSFQRILHFSLSKEYAFYPDALRRPSKPTNGRNKRYRTSVGGFKIDAANFQYADTALPGNGWNPAKMTDAPNITVQNLAGKHRLPRRAAQAAVQVP